MVYFPPGTYLVSRPIIQLYYTQFVGDAVTLPTIKAAPTFQGMAVIDADPYDDQGTNFYTNQNNFFRQVRNFVIDITAMPANVGAGIHWQVAQATSLQNIRFNMVKGGAGNKQIGIFMDNGSGGFMADLTFSGGQYGAFFGNQQFTTRNLVFDGCKTAIFMNWNWLWALKSIRISSCEVGIDMANGGSGGGTVGSVLLQDSTIANTPIGILTSYDAGQPNVTGTLVVDNVDFQNCPAAVRNNNATILAGNTRIDSWAQGKEYSTDGANSTISGSRVLGSRPAPNKPMVLLDASGHFFERSKPQYENVPASSFVSVKSAGALGDGRTDDTAAIQRILDQATAGQVVYFDHGNYVVSKTIRVPKDIRITGEIWPVLMASGPSFQDERNPKPVFQVGQPGDVGAVEISDIMFATIGAQPGATLVEWNVRDSSQGSNGMWDVHWRIGGAAGTALQSDTCIKLAPGVNSACRAAFMLLHVTSQASVYLENTWFWVADHELDRPDHSQITIYNGRGVLIESQGPVWM